MTSRRNQRRLEVVLASDARPFNKGFDQAGRQVRGFDQQVDRASKQGIGRFNSSMDVATQRLRSFVGVAAAAVASGALLRWAGQLRESANALNESVNAVNVTFGPAAEAIQQLGADAAESLGLANSEFNTLAVSFGSFAEDIAGDSGDVTEVIDTLTTRAADFASVMNIDVPEAAEKFRSGLAGETEPLRIFGIDLSAASVQAFALAEGIATAGQEMTASEKVQARYGLLLRETEKVAGDFARTSDDDANATRIFNARLEDLQADIGQAIIPAFEELRRAGEDALPALEAFGEDVLPTLVDLFGDFVAGVGEVIEFIGRIPEPVLIATGAIGGLAGAFALLNAHPVVAAISALVGGITAIGSAAREERTQVEELTEAIRELLEQGDTESVQLAIRDDLHEALRESEDLREALQLLRGQGITFDDLVSFVEGDVETIERVTAAVDRARDSAREAANESFTPGDRDAVANLISQSGGLGGLLETLETQRGRYEEATEAARDQIEAERELAQLESGRPGRRPRGRTREQEALKTSIEELSDAEVEALNERRAATEELDSAVATLADTYAQQLNSALTGYIDLTKEAAEVEPISAGQQLENVEEQVRRIDEFTAGLERLRDEGLTTLAEDIAARGPDALGALRGLVEDLDSEGGRAFELDELIEESKTEIGRFSEQFGLDLASEKVGMLAEMQNLGVDLGEALAQGLESTNITLGITARAAGVRARTEGLTAPGSGGTQFRAHGGRYTPGALVVGEREPELLFPDTGGFVATQQFVADTLRTSGSGGGGFVWNGNLQVSVPSGDPEAVGRATVRALDRKLATFQRGMPERRN